MAITKRDPNQVLLTDVPPERFRSNLQAVETITPGMIVELHNDSGTLKWGTHDSADEPAAKAVAVDAKMLNHGVDDDYSAGDLVEVAYLNAGDRFYGIIPSGQNITQGALLQSNGDGKLKAYSTGPGGFVAASSPGSVTEDTRLRVEVL